ncbi:NADH dehydrogenase [ubiquinone] 1 alpha subcomplex assembly factor 3-like [Haliotis rufescens]|uniref:NADH dehydrogenase [ubiquinone] 1 alpha subcomplex assembly factor 3-like n=1 Tax=Haliotis rufescens TaxID=6454 RepID=UPI001EAFC1F9|nr:NADH dehydrogenase [ubiquinone] 1 alpha subcomplex assembly factor 3-like [Haliotis rufescens]
MMLLRNISRCLLRRLHPQFSATPVRHHNIDGNVNATATTVTILSKEDDTVTFIDAYSSVGFKLNNGFRIFGPCAVFPRSVLHWNVSGPEDISVDSLSLFTILEPKIDILVLGIGDKGAKYDTSIIKYLRSNKINVEVLPTDQACSTFNFLNSERRYVAGALIPPTYIHMQHDEDALVRTQLERRGLYEMEFNRTPDTPGEFEDEVKDIKQRVSKYVSRDEDDPSKRK